MRVLIVAGGTAGHINPALAIAQGIKARWPNAKIFFAGRKTGMESRLVASHGYSFYHIEVRGFQRKLTPKNILRNIASVAYLLFAPFAAGKILKQTKPDLVVGAGGYVSGPLLLAATKKGIKTVIHEQNAYPGVTNKILAKHVDLVFAPTESAIQKLGYPKKTLVSGNPVNPELFEQKEGEAKEKINAGGRTVLLSYGGSLGAMRVNQVVAELAAWHIKNRNFLHIHATGSIEKQDFAKLAAGLSIDDSYNFEIREYIDNMPEMLAAADLVICRAGALTLAELAAVGRASILIPSPNVAENHQYHNAMEFEHTGAAKVFEEEMLTGQLLIETVDEITKEPQTMKNMGKKARSLSSPKALEIILDSIEKLMQNK